MTAYWAPSLPNTFVIARPQTDALPSGPNTNAVPTPAKASSRLIASPSVANTRCPAVVFSTTTANTTCNPTPQATVVQLIARRLVETADAMLRITTAPNNGCST